MDVVSTTTHNPLDKLVARYIPRLRKDFMSTKLRRAFWMTYFIFIRKSGDDRVTTLRMINKEMQLDYSERTMRFVLKAVKYCIDNNYFISPEQGTNYTDIIKLNPDWQYNRQLMMRDITTLRQLLLDQDRP